MGGFPTAVAGEPAQAGLLERRITGEAAVDYDVVLFDTPPSMGLATSNVLRAATELVIPVALTYLALDGCAELLESVRGAAAAAGRAPPRISPVVPTSYPHTAFAH